MSLRLAVVGNPIDHSKSPEIQNAALAAAGIDGSYEARRLDEAGMRRLFDELRAGQMNGANVTMPHKGLAASLCDAMSRDAADAWSVNTLLPADGTVVGYSTDVSAIRRLWNDAGFDDRPALVLGAGGAAAAAVVALRAHDLRVSARRKSAASDLLARLEIDAEVTAWGKPMKGAVVVNATPLGMRGEELPARVMAKASAVLDMAYGPTDTPAALEARERSLKVVEGLELLVLQAALSFEIWTGHVPDRAVMRSAAMASLD